MAENRGAREDTLVHDLPYSVLQVICQSMDADQSWEELASVLGYTFEQLQALKLEYSRPNGSPTRTLLWELGCRSSTVRDLYRCLSQLQRLREMQMLDRYLG